MIPPAARRPGLLALVTSPYLLLVLNMLIWAGNPILGRYLRHEITPMGLNFWRWALVLAWLLPFKGPELWEKRAVLKRDWLVLLPLGVLGVSVFNLMLYIALTMTTAVNTSLLNTVIPVVIVLLSWLLLRQTINGRQAIGIAVSLLGVGVLVTHADPAVLLRLRFNAGDLWALAAVPVWALYSVLLRRRPPELSPAGLLCALVLIGVLALLPFALLAHAVGPQVQLGWDTALGLLYVSLFASLAGFALYNHGVERLGPNVAGLFLHLVPAFTAGLAWVFLGEVLHLYHLAGVALVFAGIYLTSKAAPRPPQIVPGVPGVPPPSGARPGPATP
jgi:drug/metabolite transporter (DMT)-like permease